MAITPKELGTSLKTGGIQTTLPNYVDARVLAATTAESHTVPTGMNYVVFKANGDFYANYTTTAAIPGADVTDGSGSDFNPSIRYIKGVTTISLISPAICTVNMSFFS